MAQLLGVRPFITAGGCGDSLTPCLGPTRQSPLGASDHVPVGVRNMRGTRQPGDITSTDLFLIASARPTRRALFTASARLTLPISRRFILEGFGNLVIQSGTVEPDCRMTFAILDDNGHARAFKMNV